MIFHCFGDSIEVDKVVKGSNSLIGYIGDSEVFTIRGISDFSIFTLEGGEYAEETSDKERIEQLEQQVQNLLDIINNEGVV